MNRLSIMTYLLMSTIAFHSAAASGIQIEISYPAAEWEQKSIVASSDLSHDIQIRLGPEGIISDMRDLANTSLQYPVTFTIERSGKSTRVTFSQQSAGQSGMLSLIEETGALTLIDGTGEKARIQHLKVYQIGDTVYDSDRGSLILKNGEVIESPHEPPPNDGWWNSYSTNQTVFYHLTTDQPAWRYTLLAKGNWATIGAEENAPGGWESRFSLTIKGPSIHSSNRMVNLINYFILQRYYPMIASCFFPQLFLESSQ
jgi:hypothetical protein